MHQSEPDIVDAIGTNQTTRGPLVAVLTDVYQYDTATAEAHIEDALAAGVIEEVRPGVLRVAEPYRYRSRSPSGEG